MLVTTPRETLLQVAESLARTQYDGYFAVMRVVGDWKAILGPPPGPGDEDVPGCRTLEEALYSAIRAEIDRCIETTCANCDSLCLRTELDDNSLCADCAKEYSEVLTVARKEWRDRQSSKEACPEHTQTE
jgi:hypothetical protein